MDVNLLRSTVVDITIDGKTYHFVGKPEQRGDMLAWYGESRSPNGTAVFSYSTKDDVLSGHFTLGSRPFALSGAIGKLLLREINPMPSNWSPD